MRYDPSSDELVVVRNFYRPRIDDFVSHYLEIYLRYIFAVKCVLACMCKSDVVGL